MKRCVYYLHIPRTSGVFIREMVKTKKTEATIVAGHNFELSNECFEKAEIIIGHYGTTPIKYSDHTFSILRNPLERTYSYLKYIWSKFYYTISIENFFKTYLDNDKFLNAISNQQSKMLTGSIDLKEYNKNVKDLKDMVEINWSLNNYKTDINGVVKSIKDNNINIFNFNNKNLYQDVFKILNISLEKIDIKNKINQSPYIKEDLYVKNYELLKNINNLDLELYEYFFK